MASFYRLCATLRRPIDLLVFVLLAINLFASGSFKVFMHNWRWLFIAVIAVALVIQIVNLRTRKLRLQGISHA